MKSKRRFISFLTVLAIMVSMFAGIMPVQAEAEASIPADKLRLFYKFEETSGTTVTDSSGNGFNGTYSVSQAWNASGYNGRSYSLNGGTATSTSARYVTIPNGVLNGVDSITISTWVKWTTSSYSNQWIFALGQDSNRYIFATPRGNPGTIYSAITNVNSTTANQGYSAEQGLTGPAVLTGGSWQHLAVTIDPSAHTSVMYMNGLEIARNNNVTIKPSDLYDAAKSLTGYIGKSFYADRYFAGEIDEFKIYSTALSGEQINSLYTEYMTDAQVVSAVKSALNLGDLTALTGNITLPGSLYGAAITWQSSDPAHLGLDGTVNRPANGEASVNVTLTATIAKNGSTDTKTFNATVLAVGEAPNSININTAGKGVDLNPTLYGVFFEDINYALDGGIYPELVQNRSFEFVRVSSYTSQTQDNLFAWNLIKKDGDTGSIAIGNTDGIHVNNPKYLRISVTDAVYGVGAYNTGFSNTAGTSPTPSMAIVQNDKYNCSLFAKSSDYTGPIEVSLTSSDGSTVYASAQLDGINSTWKKLSCVLQPNTTSNSARLQVLVKGTGTVDVDMVSLFPQRTWKNRENGVRYDLGKMLSDMKPKYFRFPGGCAVEGGVIENAYRWKETVGPLEHRKNNWNFWYNSANPDYNQSYGMGFYEFFQFSEDIGATPVPAINCGMSFTASSLVSMENMGPYVQDALDLIDFANSTDMTNQWAKLRADMGHPEPFNLKYLEIGNENSGDNYYNRYKLFSDAIRAAHPEIKLIIGGSITIDDNINLTTWSRLQKGQSDADLVDEHYYVPNSTFYAQMNRYDNYDRNGQKVFIGEYASNGNNNTTADALAEASFMTQIEENGDIVELASYAPLFAKQNFTQWDPDLIWFNNQTVYGSPSYYVQKLFSRNVGNITLPTEVIKAGNTSHKIRGGFGVGSYNTAVQFDDVIITDNATGNVIFSDDFSGDASKWTSPAGTWAVSNGILEQSSSSTPSTLAYAGTSDMSDYTVTFKANKTAGAEGFLIYTGVKDTSNYLRWNIGGWSNTRSAFERCVNGTSTQLIPNYDYAKLPSVNTNQWYNIKLVVSGNKVKCYADDKLILDIVDRPKTGPVYTISSKDTNTGDIYVKVVNPQSTAQTVAVNLNGADYINPVGVKTVLKGSSATAVNSFSNPRNIYPVTTKITGLSAHNEMTFDPYSLTVLKIRTAQGDAAELDSVVVGTSNTIIKAGDTVRVNINEARMSDGSSADLGDADVAYGTSNPELVTFDSDGKATIASDLGSVSSLKVWANVSKDGVTIKSNEVQLSLSAPAVDKTALQSKIAEAQGLTETNYTAETWAALQTALSAAIAINTKADATQAEVDTAITNLQTAIAGLIAKGPLAALAGDSSVQPGSTFSLKVNLNNLDQAVYAEDITLNYDTNTFEYVDATGVNNNVQIAKKDNSSTDTVRIIAANIGGVTGSSSSVLNVSFKVKDGVQNTTGSISITKAKLGVAPQGTVVTAGVSSKTISIGGAQTVDKTQLAAAISSAEALYDSAVVGTDPGEYPQAAKDAFGTAINTAKAVLNNNNATQADVDNAVTALNSAKATFRASVVEEPGADKTALAAAINSAQSLYDNAVVGTQPGQYPQAAKDALLTAINSAKAVLNNSSATQSQVDSAVTALNSAVDTFKAAVVKELSADINSDGRIDVGDLAIVAYYYGKDSSTPDWASAKAADINNDGKIDISDLAYVASKIQD